MVTPMPLTLAHLTLGTTPSQTIDAAAQAGFPAVGLRICGRKPGDAFADAIVGHPARANELKAQARSLGIRLSNVSAYQFYPDVTWEQVAPAIDATHALGVPIVVANCFDPDLARFTDLLARYCERAGQAGIRVALEFLPYSAVRSLEAAVRVVEASGAPNAGLLLDALHLDRSGAPVDAIASLDPARIVFAQLCDARRSTGKRSDDELLQEARTARLPAGTGELPLFDFLDALPQGLEVEYEVARLDMADRSPLDKARVARQDADAFMAAYAQHARPRAGRVGR